MQIADVECGGTCRGRLRHCGRQLRGGLVRGDRLLPQTQHREDVGGHVARVQRGRRDRGVAARGSEAALGKRRVGIGMDEIVRRAGMIGMAGPKIFQDLRGLELARVGLVGQVDRLEDRERVERGRLRIIRIGVREPLHRRFVGLRARRMAATPVIAAIDVERVDERALALGLRLRRLGAAQEGRAFAQRVGIQHAAEGIAARAHRRAPPRHRAIAIGLGDRRERIDCCMVERVKPRHRRLERLGNACRAGGRKRYLAEIVRCAGTRAGRSAIHGEKC